MLLSIFKLLCITAIALTAIVATLETIDSCNFYKWLATNPDAFTKYLEDLDNGN